MWIGIELAGRNGAIGIKADERPATGLILSISLPLLREQWNISILFKPKPNTYVSF